MDNQRQPTPFNEDRFGLRLRREREQRGWTQAQLAERLAQEGIFLHPSAIAKMEDRDAERPRTIRLDEAAALARIFGVSLDDMIAPPVDLFRDAAIEIDHWANALDDVIRARARFFDVFRKLANSNEFAVEPSKLSRDVAARLAFYVGASLNGMNKVHELCWEAFNLKDVHDLEELFSRIATDKPIDKQLRRLLKKADRYVAPVPRAETEIELEATVRKAQEEPGQSVQEEKESYLRYLNDVNRLKPWGLIRSKAWSEHGAARMNHAVDIARSKWPEFEQLCDLAQENIDLAQFIEREQTTSSRVWRQETGEVTDA